MMIQPAVTTNGKPFVPSHRQAAIFSEIERGVSALLVSSVPGSGKSTTITKAIRYLPRLTFGKFPTAVAMVTFGRESMNDLQRKVTEEQARCQAEGLSLPKIDVRTIYGLGKSSFWKAGSEPLKNHRDPDEQKYRNLTKEWLNAYAARTNRDDLYENTEVIGGITILIDYIRLTLSLPTEDNLLDLIGRFEEIDLDPWNDDVWPVVLEAVPDILKSGITQAMNLGVIDFADMVWLCNSFITCPGYGLDFQPKLYDWLLVDEAQDMSPAQRLLVFKAIRKGGHLIAVGDRNQAIFGFNGASLHSMDEIKEERLAKELELDICYRCCRKVVELAASIFPGIQPRPDAPEGEITYLTADKVEATVQRGDFILCRYTAPLVTLCLQLLRNGKRATVRGKNLGGPIISFCKKAMKKSPVQTLLVLEQILPEYVRYELSILEQDADRNANLIQKLEDQAATTQALLEAYKRQYERDNWSLEGFFDFIEDFFREDKDASIILSTGHRAKGLEFPRVFILEWDKLPSSRARTPDQVKQERNLQYVMVTRAIDHLFLVVSHLPHTDEIVEDVQVSAVVAPEQHQVVSLTIDEAEAGEQQAMSEIAISPVQEPEPEQLPAKPAARRGRPPKAEEDKHQRVFWNLPPELKEAVRRWAAMEQSLLADHGQKEKSESELVGEWLLRQPSIKAFFDMIVEEKQAKKEEN